MHKYIKKCSLVLFFVLCGMVNCLFAQGGYAPITAQNITSTVNTARFIMFGGVYVDESGNSVNAVFKLDTYTGNVWILEVKKDSKGKTVKNWVAIENLPIAAVSSETDSLKDLINVN